MSSFAEQSVLVTGASGFIGAHLARRLVAEGHRVSCLVRATSRVDALRAAGVRLIVADMEDRVDISRALGASQAEVVFHLAGRVRALGPQAFMDTNASGVDRVASACAAQATPPVLVVVSSAAAAGPSDASPRREGDVPRPVSAYGRSKLAGEHAAARHADAVPITIVRPCVVFGTGDRGGLELFKPIARTGIHVVPGRGDRRVGLVAVADAVECIVLAARSGERVVPGEPGRGIYFVAAEDLSHVELGVALAAALGDRRARVVNVPNWALRAIGRAGDAVARIRGCPGWIGSDKIADVLAGSWTCSTAKARRQLGWAPATALADGLRETAAWYRAAGWL